MKSKSVIRLLFLFCLIIGFSSCGEDNSNEPKVAYNTEGVAVNENDRKEIENPVEKQDIKESIESNIGKAGEIALLQDQRVAEFYKNNDYTPIWKDANFRGDFIEALRNSANDGLKFENYHGEQIDELLTGSSLTNAEGAELDLLLTDAYFELSDHLLNGKVDPTSIHSTWGIPHDSVDQSKALTEAINNKDISQTIVSFKPQNEVYSGLRKSLQEYRENNRGITTIESGGTIELGQEDERIPNITRRFKEMDLISDNYQPDGKEYTPELQDAVEKLQKRQGLVVDGVIGPTTFEFLNKDNEERLKQLVVNLERWRWYPRNLGEHYILVNIADYRVSVIKNNDTISSRKAVVGKQGWETPLFTDTLSYAVLNPTWTIPRSIIQEDIVPVAKNDPNYLNSRNMTVTDVNGRQLRHGDIDWENATSYTFQQQEGPNNPLGRVKLIYPNKYAVYLHDTPAKQRFDQNVRAISHGCVRVQEALDLATYVLEDQPDWSAEKIQRIIDSGVTTQVPIDQEIMVHHLYYTAWRQDGETRFTQDIYNYDDPVYEKLNEA